jgi:hypothetical protein
MNQVLRLAIVATAVFLVSVGGVLAQEEEKRKLGWSNVADLGLVVTAGNTPKSTFTFDDKLSHAWERSTLSFSLGGLQTHDADDTYAVGTEDDFVLVYPGLKSDNEKYYVNGRFDKNISDRFYWVTGGGWMRDTDAGIENRVDAYLGAGNRWKDTDDLKFRTDYTLAVSAREDEIDDPLREKRYPSLRLAYDLMTKISENSQFDSDLIFFSNLKTATDWYFTNINAATANLTEMLALRASVQFIYHHLPALDEFDLFDSDPSQGEANAIGTAIARKKSLDTLVKITLVVTF